MKTQNKAGEGVSKGFEDLKAWQSVPSVKADVP